MISTFTCLHCGRKFPKDPRIKNQKYCSSAACQNARKRMHNKRTAPTSRGKLLQQARNKRWRDGYPAHAYQREYRESHPDYVLRNRERQRERNKKGQKGSSPMIVKTDAILLQPRDDGAYMAFKVKNQKIVKTDTLLLQMQSPSAMEAHFQPNTG